MSSPTTLPDIDLIDPDQYRDGPPHEKWRILRQEAPIYLHPGRPADPDSNRPEVAPFWALTKWEDIVSVSRNPRGFISSAGTNLGALTPREQPGPYAAGQMMLTTDPPRHVQMRRLVNRHFTPSEIRRLEPHLREIIRNSVNEICERGEADFVTDIASKLPVSIICEMMGVPREDYGLMFDWTNRMIGSEDPEYLEQNADAGQRGQLASMEMFGYLAQMVQKRRLEPTTDLVSVIMGSDIDGEKLSDADILLFGLLLVVAGNETTRNATSGGMLAFIENPEQRAKLAADFSLMPGAMEEVVRWVSPVIHFARTCTEDTVIRGQEIKAGEKVVMWYPSGNRDEEQFDDPYAFNVTRSPNDHVGFGMGEHFCLGSHLARLELRVVFEELFTRLPDIELAGPVHRLRSNFIAGIKHMPVRFTPTAPVEA